MITFKSVGHFLAKSFLAVVKEVPKIESGIQDLESSKSTVETVTAAAGQGALVPIEDAAYAILGSVGAALAAGGDAVAKKLGDAGLDVVAIQKVQAVLASVPQLTAVAKSL